MKAASIVLSLLAGFSLASVARAQQDARGLGALSARLAGADPSGMGACLDAAYAGSAVSAPAPAVRAAEAASRPSLLSRAGHEAKEYGAAAKGVVARLSNGDPETWRRSAKSGGAAMAATAAVLEAPALALAAGSALLLDGCASLADRAFTAMGGFEGNCSDEDRKQKICGW